jgi:hypothetical protein
MNYQRDSDAVDRLMFADYDDLTTTVFGAGMLFAIKDDQLQLRLRYNRRWLHWLIISVFWLTWRNKPRPELVRIKFMNGCTYYPSKKVLLTIDQESWDIVSIGPLPSDAEHTGESR